MAKKPAPKECNCGPLTPQDDDEEIPEGTDGNHFLSQVQLLCDDNTGVFFFRAGKNKKLFLRTVEFEQP